MSFSYFLTCVKYAIANNIIVAPATLEWICAGNKTETPLNLFNAKPKKSFYSPGHGAVA